MKILNSPYSSVPPYPRHMSGNAFTLAEAARIYFSILFGVAVFVFAYYYLLPQR